MLALACIALYLLTGCAYLAGGKPILAAAWFFGAVVWTCIAVKRASS